MNSKDLIEQADRRIAEIEDIKKTRESIKEIEDLKTSLNNNITMIILRQGYSELIPSNVINPDERTEYKNTLDSKLDEFLQIRITKLEQLLGLVPVMPPLAQGGVLVAETVSSQYFKVEKDPPEVILHGERKPATINKDFEAAVQGMIDSAEKQTICIPASQSDPIEQPEKSLDKYPARNETIPPPQEMTVESVTWMYITEGKTIKQIARHFNTKDSRVNDFLTKHGFRRTSYKNRSSVDKQPEETERP